MTVLAFVLFFSGLIRDLNVVWSPNYAETTVNEMLTKAGFSMDDGWEGLKETEQAWDRATRAAYCVQVGVAVLLLCVVWLESFGHYRAADRCALALFGMDIFANMMYLPHSYSHRH
jgi:hypothetical protein